MRDGGNGEVQAACAIRINYAGCFAVAARRRSTPVEVDGQGRVVVAVRSARVTAVPPDFDVHRPCPKCGWSPVSVKFCVSRAPHNRGVNNFVPVDHVDRECGRCGYGWVELPLDSDVAWTDESWTAARRATGDEWTRIMQEQADANRTMWTEAFDLRERRRRWWQR